MKIKIDFEDGPIGIDRFGSETRTTLHATGQEDTDIRASYLPEPDGVGGECHRPEFISATVTVRTVGTDGPGSCERKVAQLFLSVQQAADLREALHEAIVDACRKD